MDSYQNFPVCRRRTSKTISQLNEDCELLIRQEVEKCLINYVYQNETETRTESKDGPQQLCITQQMMPPRRSKMLPSIAPPPATVVEEPAPIMHQRRGTKLMPLTKKYVDMPIQVTTTTEQHTPAMPRSTALSRARQHLTKRCNSSQSRQIRVRTVRLQTDNCVKQNMGITVEPTDFLGLFEKSTNIPTSHQAGVTRDQATQMYDHITQSELFCIEWIHRNLFAVKLNPNTLVVDDRVRDASESPCVT